MTNTLYYCTNCFVVHAWPNQTEDEIEEWCMGECPEDERQTMKKVSPDAIDKGDES